MDSKLHHCKKNENNGKKTCESIRRVTCICFHLHSERRLFETADFFFSFINTHYITMTQLKLMVILSLSVHIQRLRSQNLSSRTSHKIPVNSTRSLCLTFRLDCSLLHPFVFHNGRCRCRWCWTRIATPAAEFSLWPLH